MQTELSPAAAALTEAITRAGSIRKLAKAIGITHQAIREWQRVPAERVIDVETATGVRRDLLRPDIFSNEHQPLPPPWRVAAPKREHVDLAQKAMLFNAAREAARALDKAAAELRIVMKILRNWEG
jgi:phage antirepressor YoqD-like protein